MSHTRGLLLGPEWVRAILDGRKTQTRRPIDLSRVDHRVDWIGWDGAAEVVPGWYACGDLNMTRVRHRFGVPGDVLWVRERWAPVPKSRPTRSIVDPSFASRRVWYAADGDKPAWGGPWKPSIFLRREDSRIDLEVVDIRAERAHAMTRDDAVAEGITEYGHEFGLETEFDADWWRNSTSVEIYSRLWNQTYKLCPWESNPWVWVVSFKVLEIKAGREPATVGDRHQ